jgi:ATP-dependent RNA helicase SUPV3L1/SUV3
MTTHHDFDSDDQLLIDTGLADKGISLVKMEGRVFLRMSGMVEMGRRKVPYSLVPEQGVLAKPSKWRKLDDEARKALLLERGNERAIRELRTSVTNFVAELEAASEDLGFDAEPFLRSLAEGQSSEPAGLLFDRIRQRLDHAAERQREEMHAERTKQSINLAEYPASFDIARRIPRRFIALLGPTNSGKTHKAIEALAKADSGIYLAPLRLLALENYERLQEQKHNGKPLKVNLITGEERRIEEGASHVASTVEMLDPRTPVDVAVIDEIQMLADPDRGAAWTAAVCGAPARTVYLVGAPEARKAIEALAERLECPLEVHVLKRKAPLAMEPSAVRNLRNLKRGDALIAFSRREVLMWRDLVTELGMSAATVYGNLSPEVRRAQAARFREGSADIVVGTDAIAMGLNLPIQRVVMTTTVKFNGVDEEEISAALAKQIAGRAGRYGIHEEGHVAGFDHESHEVMRALLKEKLAPIPSSGFSVAPTLEHLHRISSVTGESALARLLKRFVHNIDVPDGFFFPRITEEQFSRAEWLDTLPLSVAEKFTMSLVPVSTKVLTLQHAWEQWSLALSRKKTTHLKRQHDELFYKSLQEVEDACRLYSAYAWLGYRLPEYFPDIEVAQALSREASERVDSILRDQNATARRKQPKKYR